MDIISDEVIMVTVGLSLIPKKRLRYTEEIAVWRWGQQGGDEASSQGTLG